MPEPDQIEGFLLDRGGMVINVKHSRFGAQGTGNVNDAPAINAALAEARKQGEYGAGVKGAIVYFPPGIYRVDQPLDCNLRQFNLLGAGSHQTVIRGNTGDRAAIIEMVGGGHSTVKGMLLEDLGMPNPSSVGILYGRDQWARQSLMMSLEDVSIRLRNNPNANLVTANDSAGNPYVVDGGTFGIYNVGSEAFNTHNCFVLADTACYFGVHDAIGIPVRSQRLVTSPTNTEVQLQMLTNGASMTVVVLSGTNWLVGMHGPAVRLEGGADFIIDAHLNNASPNANNAFPYAIDVRVQTTNVEYRGSIESYQSALRVRSVLRCLRLHAYLGAFDLTWTRPSDLNNPSSPTITVPGPPVVYLDGGTLEDSTINVAPNPDTAERTGYLIQSGAVGEVTNSTIYLRRHRIKLGANNAGGVLRGNVILAAGDLGASEYATVPRLEVHGSNTGNVVVAADKTQVSGPAFGSATPPAATTLGSVVRKMEVFDRNGASLGFVPIYNTIT